MTALPATIDEGSVDHFHAQLLANRAIDDVRRRMQQDQTGHRGPPVTH